MSLERKEGVACGVGKWHLVVWRDPRDGWCGCLEHTNASGRSGVEETASCFCG